MYGNDVNSVTQLCDGRAYEATVLYDLPGNTKKSKRLRSPGLKTYMLIGYISGLALAPPIVSVTVDQIYVGKVVTANDVAACQQACVDDPGTGTQECKSITFNNAPTIAGTDNCIFNFFDEVYTINDATTANFVSAPPVCPPV